MGLYADGYTAERDQRNGQRNNPERWNTYGGFDHA